MYETATGPSHRSSGPRHRRALVTLILSAGLLPGAARADSLRCNGHLVTDDDPAARLVHACGPSSFRDPWWGAASATGVPSMTEWTYNRGPRRLMDQIVFRERRVISIATAGYGFRAGALSPNGHCSPASIAPRLSMYALLKACGEPVQRSRGYVNSLRYHGGSHRLFLRHAAHPV
ncbi:DUF2845 domain-containing protein [Salinisphaera sp. RV14]|uniref:DUF2845 domain-containing protein n=1 Tax=Salinisphaera sp. RV14 TaxID=3454140 RepID=UPI003F82C249